mgnify:CR=1 FL=1
MKAGRQSQRVTVLAFGEGVDRWREAQIDAQDLPENVSVARIEDAFLASLAAATDRQLRWSLTLSEGIIFLSSGDEAFETTPETWRGTPLA